jgi:hypothetical protein
VPAPIRAVPHANGRMDLHQSHVFCWATWVCFPWLDWVAMVTRSSDVHWDLKCWNSCASCFLDSAFRSHNRACV